MTDEEVKHLKFDFSWITLVYCIQTMFLVDDFKIVQFLLFLFTCEWGLGPN